MCNSTKYTQNLEMKSESVIAINCFILFIYSTYPTYIENKTYKHKVMVIIIVLIILE